MEIAEHSAPWSGETALSGLDDVFSFGTGRTVAELAALDPVYFQRAAALHLRNQDSSTLADTERALLAMGLDVLVTQMDPDRLRHSMRLCLDVGATVAEIVSVVEIVALVGLHSITVGFPVLFEQMDLLQEPLNESQHRLLRRMEDPEPRSHRIGPLYQNLVRFDTDYLHDFVDVIDHHYEQRVLSPRLVHLVCILIDVACSHLYEPGIRTHIELGLAEGCTPWEIAEVIELASRSGLRTVEVGLACLLDELDRRDACTADDSASIASQKENTT